LSWFESWKARILFVDCIWLIVVVVVVITSHHPGLDWSTELRQSLIRSWWPLT